MSGGIRTKRHVMEQKTFVGMLVAVSFVAAASLCFAAVGSPVLWDWRGSSICLVKPSACQDEEALYHVRGAADGKLSLQADKIVNGQPVQMGDPAGCAYDAGKKSLHCTFDRGYVDLTLAGDDLNGAMFLKDNTRWREIKLKRVKSKRETNNQKP